MIGTSPPIAGVGVTDEEARGAGHQIGSHKLEYSKVCPAADVMGEPDGIAKVIFDADTGLILGAHIFGAGAPELVQEVCAQQNYSGGGQGPRIVKDFASGKVRARTPGGRAAVLLLQSAV